MVCKTYAVKRSQIYFVDLNPTQGREQSGKRPVLVLSVDAINQAPFVVTVIPGTKGATTLADYPTNVRVSPLESGLPEETVFLCFQIRALAPERFPDRPAGRLSDEKMRMVERAVRYCLGW